MELDNEQGGMNGNWNVWGREREWNQAMNWDEKLGIEIDSELEGENWNWNNTIWEERSGTGM